MGVDILDFLNTFLKPKVFTPPQISNKSKESLFLTCSVKCSIYFGIYEPNLGESYRSNPGEPTHAGSPFRSYSTHFILSLLFIILESCRILLLVYLPQNRPESPAKLLEIHFGKGEISGVTNSHITLQHLQYLCSMYVWVSLWVWLYMGLCACVTFIRTDVTHGETIRYDFLGWNWCDFGKVKRHRSLLGHQNNQKMANTNTSTMSYFY